MTECQIASARPAGANQIHSVSECAHETPMELDRFNRYEENFLNCSRIISRNLAQLDSADGNVDKIIGASVEVEGELSEAEGYLRAMDVEFRTMSSVDKRRAQQKVTEYREEFRRLQQSYQTSKSNAESVAMSKGPAARSKLLNANQRLDESTLTLEQSRQLVAQTETIGTTVIQDLTNQREKLVDAREKVKETKNFTTEARRVLKMMGNRAIMHKICVAFMIVGLAAAIIGVGYYGVTR